MRYEIHTHETHSPMNARRAMIALARRVKPGRGIERGTDEWRRLEALQKTLEELAAVTPEDLSAWSVTTYLLLAGGSRLGGRPLVAYAARQGTLMELYGHVQDILWPETMAIDLDGAVELAHEWLGHALPRVEEPPRRYAAMAGTFAMESGHLQALARDAADGPVVGRFASDGGSTR